MNIELHGKEVQVNDTLHVLVDRKLDKLSWFLDENTNVSVTLSHSRGQYKAEVTALADGLWLRAEETTGELYASVDGAFEKLEKQIHRFRTRLGKHSHHFRHPRVEWPVATPIDDDEGKLVRVKTFPAKPMTVEEAILQLEMIGHSFFVFRSADSDTISVVYKRKDGDYGLLEPEAK